MSHFILMDVFSDALQTCLKAVLPKISERFERLELGSGHTQLDNLCVFVT